MLSPHGCEWYEVGNPILLLWQAVMKDFGSDRNKVKLIRSEVGILLLHRRFVKQSHSCWLFVDYLFMIADCSNITLPFLYHKYYIISSISSDMWDGWMKGWIWVFWNTSQVDFGVYGRFFLASLVKTKHQGKQVCSFNKGHEEIAKKKVNLCNLGMFT